MPIRVVLIGAHSVTVGESLAQLPAALDVVVTGIQSDRTAAHHALLDTTPDAVIVADDAQGWGRALLASLAPSDRPRSIVIVSSREDDAVRAFELQATDFVPMPVNPERLREAMIRVRHQVLQAALLRTADELQRLLGEVGQVEELREELAGVGASTMSLSSGSYVAPATWESRSAAVPSSSRIASARVGALGRAEGGRVGSTQAALSLPSPLPGSSAFRTPRPSEDTVLDLSVSPVKGASGRMEAPNGRPIRVLVRDGRRTRFVPVHEIDWFEADGNYIVVHTGTERFRTRGTISAIEAGLDERQFVRIHRGRVVNMDRVRELSPLPGGDGLLVLADGKTLRLSRTYRARVR